MSLSQHENWRAWELTTPTQNVSADVIPRAAINETLGSSHVSPEREPFQRSARTSVPCEGSMNSLAHAAKEETLASRRPSGCGFLIAAGNPWPHGTLKTVHSWPCEV